MGKKAGQDEIDVLDERNIRPMKDGTSKQAFN